MAHDPEILPVLRLLFRGLLLCSLLAAPAFADPDDFEPEVPDDPPDLTTSLTQQTSAAAAVTYGRFTSVQVNLNPLGNNVVGDAANEPSLAVDPNDPDHVVIGWRQFDSRFSNFRQAGYAWSTNGGITWTASKIDPGFFRSDPVLGFDAQGRFFYNSLSANFACTVFRSTNGGASWATGVPAYGGDKQWMAIDRSGLAGHDHVYEAWSSESNPSPGATFSRSSDGGGIYEAPVHIDHEPMWGTLDVDADGTLYVVGSEGPGGPIFVARSTDARDGSATPTFTVVPVDLGGRSQIGGVNPVGLLGQLWIAVDRSSGPRRGWVYVVGSVMTPSDPLDVMFIRSTDGGQTWSAPRRINDDQGTAIQWFATMSVSPDGRIDVVWNDTRGQAFVTQSALRYACSYDGGTTWSPNEQASPVWNCQLGFPNQDKIGDYYHMISRVDGFDLAWAATFTGEQDVYFMRVSTPAIATHDGAPSVVRLAGVAPNPFTGATWIRFAAPAAGARARLDVLDASGRRVARLVDGVVSGAQSVRWAGVDDAGRAARPGLYFARLDVMGKSETAKLMKLE